jgi:cell division protein FtsB
VPRGNRLAHQPTIQLRTGRDKSRSASRPATARRAAAADTAKRTDAPAPRRVTGRTTALGLVLLALMLAYAYPVRLYLDQRAQIQQLVLSQARQRATIGQLASETAKWNDPAYVAAQARARFQMVQPGTKAYIVLPAPQTPSTGSATTRTSTKNTWYGALWSALRAADHPSGP